jgi:hypothetical protein
MYKRILAGWAAAVVCFSALVLAEHRGPSQPRAEALPVPNAFDFYRRAGRLVDTHWQREPAGPSPYTDAEVRRGILAQNRAALRILRLGFSHPYAKPADVSPDDEDGCCARCGALARVLSYEAAEHAFNGRYAAALDSRLDAIRLGVDIGHSEPMDSYMRGLGCQGTGRRARDTAPLIKHLTAAEAAAGARRLAAILASESTPARIMAGQRDHDVATMTELWRSGEFFDNEEPALPQWAARGLEPVAMPHIRQSYDRFMDMVMADEERMERGAEPKTHAGEARHWPYLVDGMARGVMTGIGKWRLNRAANQLFLVALALQAWRAEHGRYPDELAALVPRLLPEAPRDPFGHGGVKYRREGDTYVLYSAGPDGQDHGGRAARTTDADGNVRYWFPSERPGDYVWGISEP